MQAWRKRLLGFTGVFIVLSIWTPLVWFTSSMRTHYRMDVFDFSQLHWTMLLLNICILIATLLAQSGFILIAHEHAELSRYKREH